MPTVKLNRKVVEEIIGIKVPEEKLKERIAMLGTDLEEINKDEIIVEIFPNRPDLLSEQGFARAVSSFIGHNTGLKKYKINKSNYKMLIDNSVNNVRPYTACCVVKNINFDTNKVKEVIQIQEKLHITFGRNRKKVAIGIYPLDKIKMPIKFIAKKPSEIKFIPLDSNKIMNGDDILKKHPTGKEYKHLLEGKEKFPIFIDSDNNILSMPPIINSEIVGRVNENTKDVFIECSGFEFEVLSKCLNIIVTALSDMGGEIYSMEIDAYGKKIISPNLEPIDMKVDLNYINKWLGLNLNQNEFKNLIEKMGFGYEKNLVLIPAYRADILHPVDIAEDIAIAYGYENIPEEIPKVATVGEESKNSIFKNKVSEILAGLGFLECKTYHIVNKENQTKKMNVNFEMVELANALNSDFDSLSYWIIPNLFEVLEKNKNREYPQNIFCIGNTFSKGESETGVLEEYKLSCLLCNEEADYTRIRQILDYLIKMIGLKIEINETKHKSFIDGRVGDIILENEEIGVIGEINPVVLSNWDIKFPVACFEIKLSKINKL